MKHVFRMTPENRSNVKKHSVGFITWGILLVCLGALAISYSTLATLASVIFLGALIAASGIILILNTVLHWRQHWSGFFLHLLMGVLYLVVGILMIKGPELASISLTLLLGMFYIFLGIFRLTYSSFFELPGHWLRILNGIITLVLGILILMAWPSSGLFVIGLFIGIDLIFLGFTYLFVG